METHFAPAERSNDEQLKVEIHSVSDNPVIDGLLGAVGGLLAVLNEKRQILALNEKLLATLGITNADEVLGLRPGEAIHCIHAHDEPGGCGTSAFCSTCGAAIAIVSSLGENKPVERMCALQVEKASGPADLYLRVRSCPIRFNDTRLLLLFLQDITRQQQWAALERVFFHDANNLLSGLMCSSDMLTDAKGKERKELTDAVQKSVARLAQEIKLQQYFVNSDLKSYQLLSQTTSIHEICDELEQFFIGHPVAQGKYLRLDRPKEDFTWKTDSCLLSRILGNMLINAFEATEPGGDVRFWSEKQEGYLLFCAWNKAVIPGPISKRIFQRNFSTKQDMGRGLGTYSMKLFGEVFLHGKIDFTTSESEGTIFRFRLPLSA